MAEADLAADIAFAATAGAAGLALAVSVWAWRLRARLVAREVEVEDGLAGARIQAEAGAAALMAFDDVRLGLRPDGGI